MRARDRRVGAATCPLTRDDDTRTRLSRPLILSLSVNTTSRNNVAAGGCEWRRTAAGGCSVIATNSRARVFLVCQPSGAPSSRRRDCQVS